MTVASENRDLYEVLGVARDASPQQIKKAYRRLAHQYHPDRNRDDPDTETRFKEAAQAYEVLSDPAKRERFDQYGQAGLSGSGLHDFSHMDVGDIFSMFTDIFGGGRRSRGRGADLQTEIELSLALVATGTERTIEFTRQDVCDMCGGTGAAAGSQRTACATCGGYGQVEQAGGLGGLFGRVITTCPHCRGHGSTIKVPCENCRGSGMTLKQRKIKVRIPAGIHDGQAIRVRGEGEPGSADGARGDLHCYIRVKAHPFLQRHDNDLVCQMPIGFTQAALGARMEVPTLAGKAELKIPAGTQHGQLFRLGGLGLPDVRTGRRGDELVQVMIEIPKRLSKRQNQLLRDYADTEDRSVLPESKKFFDRFMDYLSGEVDH